MLRVKQLICDSLNGIRIAQTILAAAIHIPDRSPRRLSGWELEHRDCRAIPGRGFLLTGETARGEVRRLWWEKPVEENQTLRERNKLSHV